LTTAGRLALLGCFQGLAEDSIHIFLAGKVKAEGAVGLRQFDKVSLAVDDGLGEPSVVEQILPLFDHA